MKGSEAFKEAIERYVVSLSDSDRMFAEKAGNPRKNLDDCVTFILNEVQNSGINGFADDEIYSLAVHYYVEDEIEVGKPIQCQVIVNHQVELTAEEIEEQKQRAKDKVFSEEVSRIKSVGKKPAPVVTKTETEPEEGLLFSFD